MSFESKVKDAYRNMQDEQLRKSNYKVTINIEKEDDKKFELTTIGKEGRVLIDDFDRAKVRKFVGFDNYNIKLDTAIRLGKNYATEDLRVSYKFVAPVKTTLNLDSIQKGLNAVLGPPKHKTVKKRVASNQGLNKVR